MIELLRKEWRENLSLIGGLAILGPVILLALRLLAFAGDKTIETAAVGAAVLPLLALVYAVAIAADLFAADISSGRIAVFAALPVRPATLWLAKVLFLFGTGALYVAWLAFIETYLLALGGVDPTSLFTVGRANLAVRMIPAAVAGAAVLFFSTLLDRGFAAVIAALATLTLAVVVVWHFSVAPRRLRAAQLALPVLMLFLAFLLGSFLAFTRGRPHLDGRIRRIALATYAFLLLFGLPMAAAVFKGSLAREIP